MRARLVLRENPKRFGWILNSRIEDWGAIDVTLLFGYIDIEYSNLTQISFNGRAPRAIIGEELKTL